jgi:hypothetical protein
VKICFQEALGRKAVIKPGDNKLFISTQEIATLRKVDPCSRPHPISMSYSYWAQPESDVILQFKLDL